MAHRLALSVALALSVILGLSLDSPVSLPARTDEQGHVAAEAARETAR